MSTDGIQAPAAASPASPPRQAWATRWSRGALRRDSKSRRWLFAAGVYLVCTATYAALAGPDRLTHHTAFNHYALLADAWLHGRQDLGGPPPAYTQNNDFAEFHGKTYVSFPPLPAMLMLPFVKLAGSAENFRDGQFVIWLSGIAPACLFLVLEKLRRTGRAPRTEANNIALSALFAFGTVYCFTAVEGTVWFAALVVAAASTALYTLFALDAERPLLAGAMMGCVWLSRPHVILMTLLFALEALRVSMQLDPSPLPPDAPLGARARRMLACLDTRSLARKYVLFLAPIFVAFAIVTWMNWTRYGRATPVYFDHLFLTVGWHARMLKWGLTSYHYFAKNLGIALSSLPWLPAPGERATFGAPFKINEHGLALWFTTPLYLWILWPDLGPRRDAVSVPETATPAQPSMGGDRRWLYSCVAASAALPAIVDLCYQNSGWRQFGYRFSNDYAVLLFVLLAVGARPMKGLFAAAAGWSLVWNLFGAATFDKAQYDPFYFREGTQTVVYQPD
jgi:hypothetical protein